jgi:hypothetical protein
MLSTRNIIRGARFIVVVSFAIAGCGGGDESKEGGDDDSNNAGAGDTGGSGGSNNGGSEAGGTDTGGNDTGGNDTGGATTGGRGGTSGRGGSAGTATGATGPTLDRIEEACEVDCDAQFALECAPANQNTLTCKANCAAQTGQLGDFCLEEYAEYVECRGAGGYDCVTTYPYPRSTCAVQQLAFSTCTMDLGCKRSCDKSVDEGCTSMTLDECIEACMAEGDALPMNCVYTYDSLAFCKVTANATCVDGELETPMACASTVLRITECIYDEEMDACGAWCWAANELGCGGADCATECANRSTDATCGTQWNAVVECGLRYDEAECADGFLAGSGSLCEDEQALYTTCVEGGGTGN